MARVIVVTSGKGGVGKTSVVANVGYALANKGLKVILIDADLGLKNLDVVLGLEGRVVYDILDVIENRCELKQAIVKDKKNQNLAILPACKNIDVQKVDITYLENIINRLEMEYDYIFIDCPAGIERGFMNAINMAKEAIVVVNLDISSIRDADKVIGILNNRGINDVKLLINKVNYESINNKISLSIDDAIEILQVPLLGLVYYDEIIQYANNNALSNVYDKDSNAARCYKAIAKRIEGEDIALTKYRKKGIFSRLLG